VQRDLANDFGEFKVGLEHAPAITSASKRLGREKAGAADCGKITGLPDSLCGPEALRRFLDNRDTLPRRNGVNGTKLSMLAIERYRDFGPGPGQVNRIWVEVGHEENSLGFRFGFGGDDAGPGDCLFRC
jgi:hypothetical protein